MIEEEIASLVMNNSVGGVLIILFFKYIVSRINENTKAINNIKAMFK